jgi:serine/threonine protein kinase
MITMTPSDPVTATTDRLSAALAERYRIEREVGQGGMATVYLARDIRHDREVAIKVLHEDLGATLGPERFLAEIDRYRLDRPSAWPAVPAILTRHHNMTSLVR